ncbi:DUF1439 domain-containing protein [Lignipirellula cremea]|uniref:Lipoprotein n=1 Tax=Lignipirellula cremea TaxID=2528010 RepID=A0A518DQZ4_9BACT|nr:DUF1439 domain-containing protein [Lignipirellula cremea]QDU94244.1 hypothetical protein Pla8534_20320 [Lignipirellula cremea]
MWKQCWKPLGLACLLLAVGCSQSLSHKVEISPEQVQSSLAASFPYSTDDIPGFESPIKATLSDPVALLEPGKNQLGVRMKITLIPPQELPNPPRRVRLPGGGPELPAAGLLGEGQPREGTVTVYGDLRYEPATGELFYKNATITDLQLADLPVEHTRPAREVVEKLVARYLDQTPIYTIDAKQFSGNLTKALLQSVTVENGKLYVELGL